MILVVEDDPLSRRALVSLFLANGYKCRAANSAEDALEMLRGSEQTGIALIDIDLPGMSGLQLLERLKVMYPKVACTLMSANEHPLSRETPFMAKPLDLKRLRVFLGQSRGD